MLRPSLYVFALMAAVVLAQELTPKQDIRETLLETDLFIDAGARGAVLQQMGYGWGDNGHQVGWSGRWITHHEADLFFQLETLGNHFFTLRAEPALKMDKLQTIGLFINNRFVEDWVCPYEQSPKIYKAKIPVQFLKVGENKLSLRIGYTTVPGGAETRRLGLQVDYILLRPEL